MVSSDLWHSDTIVSTITQGHSDQYAGIDMERTTVQRDGFDGCFFPIDSQTSKVMIVLTGSDGGLKTASNIARFYHQNGMPALALGYFQTKHTSRNLSNIPLEYLEHAIAWLKKKGYPKIGIDAFSKGTEYALCSAIAFPGISCLVLRSPSYFVSEGLCNRQPCGTSCWSYRGEALPYTAYRSRTIHKLAALLKAKEFSLLAINAAKEIEPASVLPIEKIHAPVLLLSTKSDTIWPSAASGEMLAGRLQANQHPFAFRHVCFAHLSHMLVPITRKSALIPLKLLFCSERKYPDECRAERLVLTKEIMRWTLDVW